MRSTATQGSITTEITGPLSAFGSVLTAELSPIIQSTFEYTVLNTGLNTNTVVGTGTVSNLNAMGVVGTGSSTGGTALLQSYYSLRYKSGIGGITQFSGMFTTPVVGTEQYEGIVDEKGSSVTFKNGFTVGYNGTVMGIQRWSNDTLTSYIQSSWDDPLNGTGISGLNINFTKLNIFKIQYQYLGAGNIFFHIENPTNGRLYNFHTIKYANLNIIPSTFNPNYRFTMWVNNKATTSNLSLSCGSYGLFVEGKEKYIQLHQPQFSVGFIEKTTVTTEIALFTIKNKLTYPTTTPKTNYLTIVLERLTANIDNNGTTNISQLRLVKNATLGGSPVYNDVNASNSIMSYDTAGTTVTGGISLIQASLVGKNDSIAEDLTQYDIFLSPGDTLTVSAKSVTSATINGGILWKELF